MPEPSEPAGPFEPPYCVVVFANSLSGDDDGYESTARRMVELASAQPGFLGVDSVRAPDGRGITVSYWRDRASIAGWRENAEHRGAKRLGRERWYGAFRLHIADVPA